MSVEENIRKGRLALGWSQERLARELGYTRPTISQWEKAAPKLRTPDIQNLSRLLNMPPSAFERFGSGTVRTTADVRRHAIILLRWHELQHLTVGGKVLKEALRKPAYLEVAKDISKKAIAAVIEDDSMEPEFRAGEEVVFEPDLQPENDHDFVLVRMPDGKHLFRRYRERGPGAYDLVPENPDWPTVTVGAKNPAELLGTMVEHRKRRRR